MDSGNAGVAGSGARRAHPGRSREAGRSNRPREPKLILVVEDDPDDWEIYGKILWYNGFEVLCAADGATAADLAQEHQPDLVLLDIGLPDMDGLEVCGRLKTAILDSSAPVWVLSARPEAEYGESARRAGCDRYLEKPKSPLELLHAVEEMIGRAPHAPGGAPPDMQQTRSRSQTRPRLAEGRRRSFQ